jgi:hypothetical protein
MLTITDINTHSSNLEEVERLKNEFRVLFEPTVKVGSLIIISNFPPIGDIAGTVEYIMLFLINKKHPRNYFSYDKSYYIDSFILLVKDIGEIEIDKIDNENIYSGSGSFDYQESLNELSNSFDSYISKFETVKSYSCFLAGTLIDLKSSRNRIIQKHAFTAKNILDSLNHQHSKRRHSFKSRITSFDKEHSKNYDPEFLSDFARKIIEESNKSIEPGILTKKKLDLISVNPKVVDEIYQNVGKSITIIKGKAGSGKTLTLSRLLYRFVNEKKRIRLLTYNNLLVFELKQVLRNIGPYNDYNLSIGTLHHFFYNLSKTLGITLLLNEKRVSDLLEICNIRIEKVRPVFEKLKHDPYKIVNEPLILNEVGYITTNQADNEEIIEFVRFLVRSKNLIVFDEIKSNYIKQKKSLLQLKIGQRTFLEDYSKNLEEIYSALTNRLKFYNDWAIKNRYELLAALYNLDKKDEADELISYEAFEKQVNKIKYRTHWSHVIILDEGQDFIIFEKEILLKVMGAENIIVATGGKEQLIRNSTERNWSASWKEPIKAKIFNLNRGSYRQKENLIKFVNEFSIEYGFNIDLQCIAQSKGLGKVIIDSRPKTNIINHAIVMEFKDNGNSYGCSPFESLILLIPSKGYTTKDVVEGFGVNENDYIFRTRDSLNRKTLNLIPLNEMGFICWDGVSEKKNKLKVPHQIETRVIHYESCRGIEAWTCACMSLDEYFYYKRSTNEAARHLADDLFLFEDERRDKYAALWCLMAFTRPIDTLYIHLENPQSLFSQKILEIGRKTSGTIILDSSNYGTNE